MRKTVKLSDIALVQAGGTPTRKKNQYWVEGTIPWIKISDLNSKYISESEEAITELGLNNSSCKLFPEKTILYSIFASIGETAILARPMATNQAIAGIQLTDSSFIPEYIYYYLTFIKGKMQNTARGVAQNNINLSILKNLDVPQYNFDTQKKISNELTVLDQLVLHSRQILNLLEQLVKSRFTELIGTKDNTSFQTKKIQELCNVTSGGTPSRSKAEYWDGGDILWIKTTELKNTLITDSEEKITQEGLDNSSAKVLPKGTILIAMYGQGKTRGMTGMLDVPATVNQACAALIPNNDILSEFLWMELINSYDELRSLAKGGNQPNLSAEIIKNFKIIVPDMKVQREMISLQRAIDKSKLAIQQSIDELETLKKSLMQEYFG